MLLQTILTLMSLYFLTGSLSAKRTFQVIYYPAPASAPKQAVMYGESRQFCPVNLTRYNLSDKQNLPDNGEIFALLPQQIKADEIVPQTAPRFQIPSTWERCVLLISHDPNNTSLPIKVHPINASASVFGPGECYWINLSDAMLGGRIGEQTLLVKPRSTTITSSVAKTISDYPVLIDCALPGDEKRRQLVRQIWRHNPRLRKLVFIQPMDPPRVASLYCADFY